MLGNLRNPPEPFGDVIRTHFRLKARSLAKQLDDWLLVDDGKPLEPDGAAVRSGRGPAGTGSSSAFRRDVEELKEALRKLVDGEEVPRGVARSATPEPLPAAEDEGDGEGEGEEALEEID